MLCDCLIVHRATSVPMALLGVFSTCLVWKQLFFMFDRDRGVSVTFSVFGNPTEENDYCFQTN